MVYSIPDWAGNSKKSTSPIASMSPLMVLPGMMRVDEARSLPWSSSPGGKGPPGGSQISPAQAASASASAPMIAAANQFLKLIYLLPCGLSDLRPRSFARAFIRTVAPPARGAGTDEPGYGPQDGFQSCVKLSVSRVRREPSASIV